MRWWPPVRVPSTRARVLGWFMIIVAVALSLNIVVVDELLHARADSTVNTELRHEVVKFREFARRGLDPSSGRRFTSAEQLLGAYLADAVPEEDEALFSVVDGRAAQRTRNPVPARLDRRPEVLQTAASATRSVSRTVDTAAGPAVYAAVPVDTGDGAPRAALVIVEFTGKAHAGVVQVVQIIAAASGGALLVAGAISWLVAGRILAPLRQVRRTAESIGESDLTRRIDVVPGSRDDVARLAVTFNGMLDRLESAFRTQRAFLDDAAHELRTPLTVIRGHLELMGEDPTEQAETTEVVLEEIGRMNRIVDELLVLAAAERPDFLTVEPVDLTDLVVGAVARASALAPRQWRVGEAADAVVLADGQRLTQALVQLASNAVRFTGEGDRLGVSSALRDGQVELTVVDTGTGVPDDDKGAIFNRFSRGSARSGDGTGLGLAIVASIATAHQGRIGVADTPGGGATFTLTFPARFPPEPGSGASPFPAADPEPHTRPPRTAKEWS